MAFNFCLDCTSTIGLPAYTGCGLTRTGGIKRVGALSCNVKLYPEFTWEQIFAGAKGLIIFYKDAQGVIQDSDAMYGSDGRYSLDDIYYEKYKTQDALIPSGLFKWVSNAVMGGITGTNPTSVQMSGCTEPEVVSMTKQIQLDFYKNFSTDNSDIVFWKKFQQGAGNFNLILETCDSRAFIIPTGYWSVSSVNDGLPTSNKEARVRGITISWTTSTWFADEYISPALDLLV